MPLSERIMSKNYLWVIGEGFKTYKVGDLMAGRYQIQSDQIALDTQPDILPDMPVDIPTQIDPYLKLFPWRLYVPQVYGRICLTSGRQNAELWLLEGGPISEDGLGLMPRLSDGWREAGAVRQIHWLWQIAQLWQPFQVQRVVSTLLNSELLRVEGPVIKILQLAEDESPITLHSLGRAWQSLLPTTNRLIIEFLEQTCEQLLKGEIRSSEQLIGQLDRAWQILGRSQERKVTITTATDTGPSRDHNEDACYPDSRNTLAFSPYLTKEGFAIVCDGVGGQDGGEIASRLAIDSITAKIKDVGLEDRLNLATVLEKSVCVANDAICDRNDSEKRQGRRRMGTTLVTAWAYEHELYVAHIGDSRAYLITRQNCYQVTLDDDVASRDVRLGYALYLDALQQVASGALVQALGITPSMNLHPTVQRFPVDEDCVFLLCSDGLSDRNRVDENWQEEILPLLDGKTDINTLREELIEIANTQNGHDNVTIALIHYQVTPVVEEKMAELDIPPVIAPSVPTIVRHLDEDEEEEDTAVFGQAGPTTQQPDVIEKVAPVKNLPKTLLLILLSGLVIGLIGYSLKTLIPELKKAMNSGIEVGDGVTASPSIVISPATPKPVPIEMKVGEYFQVQLNENVNYDLSLVNQIDGPEKIGTLPAGSIFRVKNMKNIPVANNSPTPTISPSISPTAKPSNSPIKSEEQWLQLEVCQVTPSEKPSMGNSSPIPSISISPASNLSPSPSPSPSPDATNKATPTDNLGNENPIPVLTAGGSGWIMRSSISDYPLQRLTNIELEKLAPNGLLGKCQLNANKTPNK